MTKFLRAPLLAGLILCAGLYAAPPSRTILDYFQEINHPMLTKSLMDPSGEYNIEKRDVLENKLQRGKLTIDIPNYFIQITSKGGLGREFIEYALYSPDKDPIFAISRQYTYFNPKDNFIAFLTKKGSEWIDITDQIFPKIDLALFAGNPSQIKNRDKLLEFGSFRAPLPQKGTAIKLEFDIVWYNWANSGLDDAAADTLLAPLTYQFVNLNWNKTKRKFEIGTKELRKK